MFLYLRHRDQIYLLHLFGKNEREDLSDAERSILRDIVNEIKMVA